MTGPSFRERGMVLAAERDDVGDAPVATKRGWNEGECGSTKGDLIAAMT